VARIDIRRAEAGDSEMLGETLALAMHDDPVFAWWIPDETLRDAVFVPMFTLTLTEKYIPRGEVYWSADGAAAAMWAPTGRWQSTEAEARSMGPRMVEILGPHLARAGIVQQLVADAHPTEPHYHLQTIGVRPRLQGRGIGGALLADMLARCDEEGVAAYLEASNENSRRLYERHGFIVQRELPIPDGPSMWTMWRSPRS
jgi:ribosomal protein S18 acetylase RimI-like enzyme